MEWILIAIIIFFLIFYISGIHRIHKMEEDVKAREKVRESEKNISNEENKTLNIDKEENEKLNSKSLIPPLYEDKDYRIEIGPFSWKVTDKKRRGFKIPFDRHLMDDIVQFDYVLEAYGIKAIRYFDSKNPHHPLVLNYLRAVCIARCIPDERQKFFNDFHPELYAEECAETIKAEGESSQKYLITSNLQKIF